MAKPKAVGAAALLPVRTPLVRFLLNPLVVFIVTFSIRAALFTFRYSVEPYIAYPVIPHPSLGELLGKSATRASSDAAQSAYVIRSGWAAERLVTPPPLHFSMSIPMTEASTWREVVYWRDRGFADGVPFYLQTLAPWYVRFIPSLLAQSPLTGLALSAVDGVTAALISRWSSVTAALLYALFVLNPFIIFTTTSESLTSVELLLMTLTVDFCTQRTKSVIAYAGALLCALTLGSHFIALPMALLAPLGIRSYTVAFSVAVALAASVGIYSMFYLYITEVPHHSTSLYAPPDNGVIWYVRQLILPSFGRCLELFMIQLASMLLIPVSLALPRAYLHQSASSAAHPHLFTEGRLFLVLMAEGLSVFFRSQLTLPYCFLIILHFYSSLNPAATKTVTLEDERVVTYSPYKRVRLLVPIFLQLISVPLEVSFYAGWVIRETANANWKFFADVVFVGSAASFFVLWFTEVMNDALVCEEEEEDGANAVACSAPSLSTKKTD
ncbi:hypothetical protein JKF63_00061 [Porcisia hertigi]|uniref:Uncharacterized protein n=1 Tax=Porcisia hertigi TaxID=2761500 RepID=A0A836I8V5_9TRYP|nr:hypothetical protein JKF63_00061 [Porcisia hertigi]